MPVTGRALGLALTLCVVGCSGHAVDEIATEDAGVSPSVTASNAPDAGDASQPDATPMASITTCVARSPTPAAACGGSVDCAVGQICCAAPSAGTATGVGGTCSAGPCATTQMQRCTDNCECASGKCMRGVCNEVAPSSCVPRNGNVNGNANACRGSLECPSGTLCCAKTGAESGACTNGPCGASTPTQLCTADCECTVGTCGNAWPYQPYGACR